MLEGTGGVAPLVPSLSASEISVVRAEIVRGPGKSKPEDDIKTPKVNISAVLPPTASRLCHPMITSLQMKLRGVPGLTMTCGLLARIGQKQGPQYTRKRHTFFVRTERVCAAGAVCGGPHGDCMKPVCVENAGVGRMAGQSCPDDTERSGDDGA